MAPEMISIRQAQQLRQGARHSPARPATCMGGNGIQIEYHVMPGTPRTWKPSTPMRCHDVHALIPRAGRQTGGMPIGAFFLRRACRLRPQGQPDRSTATERPCPQRQNDSCYSKSYSRFTMTLLLTPPLSPTRGMLFNLDGGSSCSFFLPNC